MRKFVLTALVLGCFAANVQAGAVFQKFLGNGDNILKDNSVGLVAFKNTDPTTGGSTTNIGVGDILQGVIRIDQNTQGNPYTATDTDQLIIAYSFTLAAGTHGAAFDLAPTTNPLYTLSAMLPTQIPVNTTGSIFAVLDGTSGVNPTAVPLAAAELALDDKTVYSLDLIGGIAAANDFLGTQLATTSIAVVAGLTPTDQFGTDKGGLSVLVNDTNNIFHTAVPVNDFSFSPTGLHDIGYSGTLLGASPDQKTNGYLFGDSTNVELNVTVTPEPASLVMWGIGFGIAAVVAYRRRKA
jgi:hypothetical protein